MEVKIMSQAGPEKRTIKATCEQRLPQSTAQAAGFMAARYQASTELEGGHRAVMSELRNSTPSLRGGTRKTVRMHAEGWIQGAEMQANQKRGSGGSS